MKLLILGATGGIGLEIVKQAIDAGHQATALVRTPERLKEFAGRIAVIQGDVLNSTDLERALEGQDAVLSGFGAREPRSKADADLLRRFAVALTRAMLHVKIRRVIVVSVAFLFTDSIIPPTYLFGRLFFRDVVTDSSGLEDIFRKSALDWTILRPPQLTDKPYTGKYRVREGHLPRFGFKISRADVADCLIKSLEGGGLHWKIL
jgi:putative NADH-flavin reductase